MTKLNSNSTAILASNCDWVALSQGRLSSSSPVARSKDTARSSMANRTRSPSSTPSVKTLIFRSPSIVSLMDGLMGSNPSTPPVRAFRMSMVKGMTPSASASGFFSRHFLLIPFLTLNSSSVSALPLALKRIAAYAGMSTTTGSALSLTSESPKPCSLRSCLIMWSFRCTGSRSCIRMRCAWWWMRATSSRPCRWRHFLAPPIWPLALEFGLQPNSNWNEIVEGLVLGPRGPA